MINRTPRLDAFERSDLRSRKMDYARARVIFNEMYMQAKRLGVVPAPFSRKRIEHKIRLAKALHAVRKDPVKSREEA